MLQEHGVQGLSGNRLDAVQQITHDQSGGHEGQGDRHVVHGPLGGLDPGLPQDRQAVADCLDPRVGPGPHAVGPQEQQDHGQGADLCVGVVDVGDGCLGHLVQAAQVGRHGPDDGKDVGQQERQERWGSGG